MKGIILVSIGGALGAVARHILVSLVAQGWKGSFPLGTWIVNISGSFVIGLLLTLINDRAEINPEWRLLLAVGFIGAYTTFSTFEYEALRLLQTGQLSTAIIYVTGSVIVGLLAVWTGVAAARQLLAIVWHWK